MDVLSQSKMPRPEGSIGTVISRELLKSTSLSGYSHEKSVPYSEDFISFSMSRQEGMDLSGPWSQSGSCLRNGRSPVIPSLVTEGSITNPIIYRPENVVFPVDDGSPLTAHEQTAKQRFAYYDSSPGKHSAIASGIVMPVAIRKHPVGPVSISPPMPNPVGLAVPKPVYGHSPCCSELGCMTGPRYVVDRGSQKIPSHVYEDEWMAQYGHLSYLHKKEQEASMQKKALQVEHSGERVPLKDVTTEGYHGMGTNGHKRVSSFIEPNHRSHPCSSPRSFMAPSSEHCQRFQNPSKIYKPLPTSHPPVYEPVTIAHHGITQKVYHDHPHVPKYSQIPQHSMFYYPHNNMDVCRDEHPPHIPHSPQSPPEQCHIPQPVFSDLPNPYPVTPRSHAFVSNFPGYHAHRMHLNASRMKSPSDRPCPPLPTQHSDRPLDFSMPRAHMVGAPKGASGQPGAFQPRQSKANFGSHSHPAVQRYSSNCSDWRGSDSPVRNNQEGFGGAKHTDEISNKQTSKNTPLANAESSSKRKSEGNSHVYELKTVSKIQKRENGEGTDVCQIAPSPPMPVINNVFSLAPYKAYLEAAGMLPTATGAKGGEQQNHSNKLKQESVIHNRSHKQNLDEHEKGLKQQSKAAGEVLETVMIKKEKIDQQEILCHEREDKNHNELGNCIKNGRIKEEPEESEEHIVADTMFPQIVIKGDYEAEKKSLSPEKSERLTDCKIEPTIMPSREYSSSPRAVNKLSPLTATHAPETSSPPQLPETKFFHQKIPPHCLKLSACNIVMPDNLRASAPRVKQVPQSPGEIKPSTGKSSRQARHQFMELHQSLCRLISRCISQTPQQELRTWMSCMDLGEPVSPSAKAPKISCLLGSKAREMWLKDEETVMALQKVLIQLETYVGSCECPFPHVIRAGAVFIPMLVVKEVLFPQVQGSFIDQVLQEHRVELRPTTLSEERHLMQLQRRACSSKLRKLLSLKHLPDIYPDVLNLHYHDCVSKLLDSNPTEGVQKTAQV